MTSLPPVTVPDGTLRGGFARSVRDFPTTGPPGLHHWRGRCEVGDITQGSPLNHRVVGRVVVYQLDCLLYRNSKGRVIGALHYFAEPCPGQSAGDINVFVHPRRQRRGIGMALLREAERRWGPLDMGQQSYTAAGRALAERFVADR